jgi:hypothetical protein
LPFLKDKSPISYKEHKNLNKHEKIYGIVPDRKSEDYITKRLEILRLKLAAQTHSHESDNYINEIKSLEQFKKRK